MFDRKRRKPFCFIHIDWMREIANIGSGFKFTFSINFQCVPRFRSHPILQNPFSTQMLRMCVRVFILEVLDIEFNVHKTIR